VSPASSAFSLEDICMRIDREDSVGHTQRLTPMDASYRSRDRDGVGFF